MSTLLASNRSVAARRAAHLAVANHRLAVNTFHSQLGWMALAAADAVLVGLVFGYATSDAARAALALADDAWTGDACLPELARRLTAYAAGEPENFADVAVDLGHLTPFEHRVMENCRRIPFGQTLSYGRLATQAGSPGAARAVGNVMAGNRCPLVIPCHRVVAAGGRIGNYSAPEGRRMKLRLLEQEGAWPAGRRQPGVGFAADRYRGRPRRSEAD